MLDHSVWAGLFAKAEEAESLDWGRSHLRFHAADRARGLVDRELVEHWLVYGNLRYPQLNLSYGGDAAPPTSYTRNRRIGQHQLPGCAHADDIIAQLDQGATLVLSNPEQWDEHLAAFCAQLGGALSASVQSYVYLTAPERYGSRPHRDEGDVFAVQLEGTKTWTLYGLPDGDDWDRGHLPEDTPVTEELVLRPGDGLYVPSGMGHRAQSGPEGSLHLTVSVGLPRARDVVSAWTAFAVREFSRHEHLAPGSEGREEAVRDILRRLAEVAAGTDPAVLAAAAVPAGVWPETPRPLTWPTSA
ncbi:JmjC domain-containing protein [Longispora urticae]